MPSLTFQETEKLYLAIKHRDHRGNSLQHDSFLLLSHLSSTWQVPLPTLATNTCCGDSVLEKKCLINSMDCQDFLAMCIVWMVGWFSITLMKLLERWVIITLPTSTTTSIHTSPAKFRVLLLGILMTSFFTAAFFPQSCSDIL